MDDAEFYQSIMIFQKRNHFDWFFLQTNRNFCTKLLGMYYNLYRDRGGEIAPKVILHYHILHFFNQHLIDDLIRLNQRTIRNLVI